MPRLSRALWLAGLLVLTARADNVLVFTAEGLPPLSGLERADQVFVLDDLQRHLDALRFEYPGDDAAALEQARARLNAPRGKQQLQSIKTAANAAAMAWLMGVEQLPAVWMPPGLVVYGVFDVAEAIHRIEDYQHAQAR